MELDVKKTSATPKDGFEAIRLLVEAQQNLIDAMFIMDSIINDDSKDLDNSHLYRMEKFIDKFES